MIRIKQIRVYCSLIALCFLGAISLPCWAADSQVKSSTETVRQPAKDSAKNSMTANPICERKCHLSIVDPHCANSESEAVLQTLEELVQAYANGNWETFDHCLDERCTTFDKESGRLVSGKEEVLEHLKKAMGKHGPESLAPLVEYTIEEPFAKVHGNDAVVTYHAVREFGGKKPIKMESYSTDIFVKKDGHWIQTHYISDWKKAG